MNKYALAFIPAFLSSGLSFSSYVCMNFINNTHNDFDILLIMNNILSPFIGGYIGGCFMVRDKVEQEKYNSIQYLTSL